MATTIVRPTITEVLGDKYFDSEVLEELVKEDGSKKRSVLRSMHNTLVV